MLKQKLLAKINRLRRCPTNEAKNKDSWHNIRENQKNIYGVWNMKDRIVKNNE